MNYAFGGVLNLGFMIKRVARPNVPSTQTDATDQDVQGQAFGGLVLWVLGLGSKCSSIV